MLPALDVAQDQQQRHAMDYEYQMPAGMHAIRRDLLDLRPDAEIDSELLSPPPVTGEKNIWFFWNTGYANMPPYSQRNIRAWHRRFSRLGWAVRVLDVHPGSPANVAHFLDVADPAVFPRAFTDGTLGGTYAAQHTSDLVRWPLLLRYGGVYADVGMLQIGDLDRLWRETLASPDSPYEVLSYSTGEPDLSLTNYFLCARKDNPLFLRSHKLLLALWAEGGGRTSTDGMWRSPLIKEIPLCPFSGSFTENGRTFSSGEVSEMLTDYIIQGQALTMAMSLVDAEDGWDGPQYVRDHVYAIEFMVGAQLINHYTSWKGQLAFDLMSLPLPEKGAPESAEQEKAREIVEGCLGRSFGFKLATGLILRVNGDTLSSLWRKNVGSDNVPGTYAHWLRHGTLYWTQDKVPPTIQWKDLKALKTGRLLEA